MSPFDTVPLSLLHPFLPPKSPGCGSFVYLDVAPARHPLPPVPALTSIAVLNLLPMSLSSLGFLCCMPVNSVSLIHSLPLCRSWPMPRSLSSPRGFPFQGSLHPSAFLLCPHVSPPPPAVLDWQLSPLQILRGLCRVLCPPVPCASASSSLLLRCLLVSSGFCFLRWMSFCT